MLDRKTLPRPTDDGLDMDSTQVWDLGCDERDAFGCFV